jgi:C4-dicarboxylate-specific signal transduction histidine kinase
MWEMVANFRSPVTTRVLRSVNPSLPGDGPAAPDGTARALPLGPDVGADGQALPARSAQDQLARATQLSSLAELSASIAHEVNQPLAAIVANAHACQRWLSADPPNIERARLTSERIIRDANAAAAVINGIRALFKQSPSARAAANINDVIMEVGRLMSDELGNADVRFELDAGLAPIIMDRVQIQQVLVNLIRNAIEALDSSPQSTRALSIHSFKLGNEQVGVEVVDSGKGLDEPDRIFEPFFTTKPNGMGMGLAICRSIIESHSGRLWAQRNEPMGTKFAFTLPIREPEKI